MNWLNAYINAVKTNLPKDQREDIAEELRGLLGESLQAATGKPPTEASEAETLAWLKTREHPAVVAARYHQRRSLISEESFPLYKLAVRYTLIAIAVIFVFLAIIQAFTTGRFNPSIWMLASNVIHNGLLSFAIITLVFHFAGEHLSARKLLAQWNPKDLPDPEQKWEHEPWSSSIGGLVCTGIFLLFINGFLQGFADSLRNDNWRHVELHVIEEAHALLPYINIVLIASLALYGFMIVKPYWSTTTLVANALLSLGSAIIIYRLQEVAPFVQLAGMPEDEIGQAARVESWINTSLHVGLLIMLILSVWEFLRDLRRLNLLRSRRPI